MSLKQDFIRIKNRTIQAFEENPVLVMAASAATLTGAAKLLDANTKRKNSKTWRREVTRREKKLKHRHNRYSA